MLCQYKNIFGEVGTGFHSTRFFDIAIYDVIGTFGLALILQVLSGLSYRLCVLIMFLIAIISHRLFCVRTTIDKILFEK